MSERFVIELSTNDNAAFADDSAAEVVRILRETAERIERGDYGNDGEGFPLKDVNGNRCGSLFIGRDE